MMGISLFDLIVNLIEGYTFYWFFINYFETKSNYRIYHFILFVLAYTLVISLINIFIGFEDLLSIFMSLFLFFPFLFWYVKGSLIEKLYISFFSFELISMVVSLSDIGASLGFYGKIDIPTLFNEHYYFMVILVKSGSLAAYKLIAKVRKSVDYNSEMKSLLLFVCVSLISTVAYIRIERIMDLNIRDTNAIAISIICLLLVNIFIFLFFFQIQKDNKKKREGDLELQTLKFQENLMELSRMKMEETSKIKHDLKHFLIYVENLVVSDKQQLAILEIREYIKSAKHIEQIVKTNNEQINYIFNWNFAQYNRRGGTVKTIWNQILFSKNIDMKLLGLIWNVMEGAIEHVSNLYELHVAMKEEENKLILSISYPIESSNIVGKKNIWVKRMHKNLDTYEFDHEEKYNGKIEFFEENGKETFKMILY